LNYLGHAVFSPSNDLITLGNLSGDFLKNHFHAQLVPSIVEGVYLHRAIDSYTDNHLSVREMTSFFRPHFGKYSGVVVDVLLDKLLSEVWSSLFSEDFSTFCRSIYKTIQDGRDFLPPKPALIMGQMVSSDWLSSYGEEERILGVFRRLSIRANIDLSGVVAIDLLNQNRENLIKFSLEFFTDLKLFLNQEGLLNDSRVEWR